MANSSMLRTAVISVAAALVLFSAGAAAYYNQGYYGNTGGGAYNGYSSSFPPAFMPYGGSNYVYQYPQAQSAVVNYYCYNQPFNYGCAGSSTPQYYQNQYQGTYNAYPQYSQYYAGYYPQAYQYYYRSYVPSWTNGPNYWYYG